MSGSADTGRSGVYHATNQEAGTGSAISCVSGFTPGSVLVVNKTRNTSLFWNREMGDAEGWKAGAKELVSETYGYVKGSANTDSENSDAASEPTNGHYVNGFVTTSSGYTAGSFTNPDVARNVGIVIKNDTAGNLNLYVGVMTFTITGTDIYGAAQTDTVTFTSSSGNKAIAHNPKYRYKYGTKAFLTVTGCTLDNAPDDGLKIAVALGSKVKLPRPLYTPAASDILTASKTTAGTPALVDPTSVTDTTNMTVNWGTLTDADQISLVYFVAGERSKYVSSNGITPTSNGFTIGADADINVASDVLYWTAWRL